MGAVTVYYDNVDLLSGIGPAPLISRDVENVYINRTSHLVNKFSLSGRIHRSSCISGFADPYSISRTLINRLSKNFRKFEIKEDATSIFSSDYAVVRGVSFNSDDWYDWIPYTIEIDCYDKGFFESYGIIEPEEQFDLEILPNNTVQVSISVSCRGLNKSFGGATNAKTFISSFGSYNPASLDFYWPDVTLSNYTFFLTSRQESINRLTGEASVELVYIGQLTSIAGSYGVLTYTRDMDISENGEVTVTINGTEKGALNAGQTLLVVETDVKNRNWHTVANELYTQVDTTGTLFSNPIKFSLQRDISNENVSFTISFSNQQNNNVYVIDQTTITHDYEKSTNCIEASLTIKSNFGCHAQRWTYVSNYYSSLNFNTYVQTLWNKYGQTSRLNFLERNRSYSENRYEGSINITAKFCDNSGEDCGCLQDFVYDMEFGPPIKQYSVSPTLGGYGCYYIEDLQASKRGTFSLRGSVASAQCCAIEKTIFQLKNKANQLANSFFAGSDKILESSQVTKSEPNGRIGFDFTWSADQGNIIPSNLL